MRPVRPLAALLFVSMIGCQSETPRQTPGPASAPEPVRQRFGERLRQTEIVALGKILENPEAYSNRVVTVEGQVRRACSKKGCWMELAEAPGEDRQGCRVTFKDYGFFVPTDAAGAKARAQGLLKLKRVEAPSVNHLEQEGARFANKAADGSAQEVRLVATGVELWH